MPLPSNPFESGERKVIPAVLVYVWRGDHLLMLHRGVSGDYHEGKWNGLGGKLEKDESPLEAAQREVFEESGLSLPSSQLKSLGVLQFPNFKAHKSEDWVVFVFSAEISHEQEPGSSSNEGTLHWIPKQKVLSLNLWPGDHSFMPYVLSSKPFMGTVWYKDQAVAKHWITELGADFQKGEKD